MSNTEKLVFSFKDADRWIIKELEVQSTNTEFQFYGEDEQIMVFRAKFFPKQFIPTMALATWFLKNNYKDVDTDTIKFLEMPVCFGSQEKKE